MKTVVLLILVCFSPVLFAQETMKEKLKPRITNYLKAEPLYRSTIINDVIISNISILDEKEKNKSLYDFYHSYRITQLEQIGFIKGKASFIEQYCAENKVLYKKYIGEIKAALLETAPLIDSLWVIEDQYKAAPNTSNQEYYLVTFDFKYTLGDSKVTEKNHRVLFTNQFDIIHHEYLNK